MKTIGVFAGSFNPWHQGHQDIFDQAKLMFDKVIVCRGINPGKLLHKDPFKELDFTYRGLLTDAIDLVEKENPKYKI